MENVCTVLYSLVRFVKQKINKYIVLEKVWHVVLDLSLYASPICKVITYSVVSPETPETCFSHTQQTAASDEA